MKTITAATLVAILRPRTLLTPERMAAYCRLLQRYGHGMGGYGIECHNGVDFSGFAWKTKRFLYSFDREDFHASGKVKDYLTITPLSGGAT